MLRQALQSSTVVGVAMLLTGCHTDMWTQNKQHLPLGENSLFTDGAASRPLVAGTIPRDHLREDTAFFTGYANGKPIAYFPVRVTKELLLRGQDRFKIYCTPCHGQLGDGQGMIAHRGLALRKQPGNYHTDRLRAMPVGHFYDVITRGYGVMFSYASRVEPQDRWAIVAYIRALQLSQHATPADADAAGQEQLRNPAAAPGGTQPGAHE